MHSKLKESFANAGGGSGSSIPFNASIAMGHLLQFRVKSRFGVRVP